MLRVPKIPARLQIVRDILEYRSDLRAEQDESTNDDNRDECDDERILDKPLAAISLEDAIEHYEMTPPSSEFLPIASLAASVSQHDAHKVRPVYSCRVDHAR